MSNPLRTAAVLALGVTFLAACEHVKVPEFIDPDPRPEGRRYVDYLTADGGLAEISVDLSKRSADAAAGRALSFTGRKNFDPYNAPLLGKSKARRELQRLKTCILSAWPGQKPTVDVIISSGLAPAAQGLPNQVSMDIGLIGGDDITAGEIAFVLAHELSHVLLDHYERAEFLKQQQDLTSKLAGAAILAAYASEMRAQRSGNKVTFVVDNQAGVNEIAMLALAAYSASQLVADGMIEASWSRNQEFEADRLALDLLVNAGVSEEFSYQALDRLETFQTGQKSRLEKLSASADGRMNEAMQSQNPNLIITTGAGVFMDAVSGAVLDGWDFLDRSHPSPQSRKGEVDDYLIEFEDVGMPQEIVTCDVKRLEKAIKGSEIKRAKRALASAAKTDDLLAARDYAGARAAARKGLSGGLERHPVTRMAAFRVEKTTGQSSKAMTHLKKIRLTAETPLAVYSTIAGEYIVKNQLADATRVLNKAQRYYLKDNFYPQRLQIASARGNTAEIERLRVSCEASAVAEIPKACRRILNARNLEDMLSPEAAATDKKSVSDTFKSFFENLTPKGIVTPKDDAVKEH